MPLDVHRDGPSADPFAELVLPSGRTVLVEVDTGSDCLILDTRFMAECGLEVGGPGVSAREGVDETGNAYVRYDATLAGAVHLAGAPETAQDAPKVIFQEIIHDGLVGSDFLYRYRFSFDLAGERMVLGPLSGSSRTLRSRSANRWCHHSSSTHGPQAAAARRRCPPRGSRGRSRLSRRPAARR